MYEAHSYLHSTVKHSPVSDDSRHILYTFVYVRNIAFIILHYLTRKRIEETEMKLNLRLRVGDSHAFDRIEAYIYIFFELELKPIER